MKKLILFSVLLSSLCLSFPSFGNVEFIDTDVYVVDAGGSTQLEKILVKNPEKDIFKRYS